MPRTQSEIKRALGSYIRVFLSWIGLDFLILTAIVGTAVYIAFSIQDQVLADKLNCSAFTTQTEAQKVFDTNRSKYKSLDRDHDGKPCERLP